MRDEPEARFGSLKCAGAETGCESYPKLEERALWHQLDHDDAVVALQAEGLLRAAFCTYLGQIGTANHPLHPSGGHVADAVPLDDRELRAADHTSSDTSSASSTVRTVLMPITRQSMML